MPSIFMWKATSPLITTSAASILSYYSGSDWFLEEHPTYSKSAMYLNQQSLSNHGWMYDIKWMPTNWVGSYLLESVSVPYALLKEDILGRLEQLGDWMRFTTYREVDDKEAEWERIQEWVTLSERQIILPRFQRGTVTDPLKTGQPITASVKMVAKPCITKPIIVDTYEPCLINLSAGNVSAGNLSASNLSAGNVSSVQPSLPIYSRPSQQHQQYRQHRQHPHQPLRQQPYQKKRISA